MFEAYASVSLEALMFVVTHHDANTIFAVDPIPSFSTMLQALLENQGKMGGSVSDKVKNAVANFINFSLCSECDEGHI